MNMTAKIMPHGWMEPEARTGRPKFRCCIALIILWAALVLASGLMLWIENDATFPKLPALYWFALTPGPILAAIAIYFRLTEPPRPLHRKFSACHEEPPVIH